MGGHHLILGKLVDFITGKTIVDTHDERYRQKIARILVNKKGYGKNTIESRCKLIVTVEHKRAIIIIDFKITSGGKIGMIVKYGPGSIVSRHRPALAASRLIAPYQVPFVVVTNGEDADILDGPTGRIISQGLDTIPICTDLITGISNLSLHPISTKRIEMESRILYAFEVDDSCPCDDTVIRM